MICITSHNMIVRLHWTLYEVRFTLLKQSLIVLMQTHLQNTTLPMAHCVRIRNPEAMDSIPGACMDFEFGRMKCAFTVPLTAAKSIPLTQGCSILVRCPVRFRCFPAPAHLIQMNCRYQASTEFDTISGQNVSLLDTGHSFDTGKMLHKSTRIVICI